MASHPDSFDIEIPGLASQFIGGAWVERNSTFVDIISPTTEAPLVQVADPTPVSLTQPFGGYKQSGWEVNVGRRES